MGSPSREATGLNAMMLSKMRRLGLARQLVMQLLASSFAVDAFSSVYVLSSSIMTLDASSLYQGKKHAKGYVHNQ
jgi:hypothetical protein